MGAATCSAEPVSSKSSAWMDTPLARAAKRGCTFIFVPMMLELPPHGPSDSMYCRMRGPAVEADPASAKPNPSRIVFLPSAITLSGMSSYFVFTINSETYLVSPGALANSSAGFGEASACSPRQGQTCQREGCLAEIASNHEVTVGQASSLSGLVFYRQECNGLKPVLFYKSSGPVESVKSGGASLSKSLKSSRWVNMAKPPCESCGQSCFGLSQYNSTPLSSGSRR